MTLFNKVSKLTNPNRNCLLSKWTSFLFTQNFSCYLGLDPLIISRAWPIDEFLNFIVLVCFTSVLGAGKQVESGGDRAAGNNLVLPRYLLVLV